MTNHERWQFYNVEHPAPQTFVDASWCFLVSSCLERRVWMKSGIKIWPNQYVIFVADPGIGKSITAVVREFLSYFKKDKTVNDRAETDGEKATTTKLLFPMSATSSSYAKFIEFLSNSITFFRGATPPYAYCASAFVLEELSSVFKRESDEMITFLLEGWDCTEEHSNATISRGVNYVKNACVNLIAGTQPDKFHGMLAKDIIGSGLTARAIFLYANESRTNYFIMPSHTDEQRTEKLHILQHMLKLSEVYGEVTMTPEAEAFAIDYWKDQAKVHVNKSPFLAHYYTRKKLHIHKIAIAFHFGESLDRTIGVETYRKAIAHLDEWEKNMHIPFSPRAKTDVADVKDIILRMLGNSVPEMGMIEMFQSVDRKIGFLDFQTAVGDLVTSQKLTVNKDKFRLKR